MAQTDHDEIRAHRGRLAHSAYVKHRRIQGDRMPLASWALLSDAQRAAWASVVEEVQDARMACGCIALCSGHPQTAPAPHP